VLSYGETGARREEVLLSCRTVGSLELREWAMRFKGFLKFYHKEKIKV
jgi:hypothetical protein